MTRSTVVVEMIVEQVRGGLVFPVVHLEEYGALGLYTKHADRLVGHAPQRYFKKYPRVHTLC